MKIGQQLFYRHMNGSSLPPQKIKCHFPRLPKVCFWRSCPSKMCLWLPRYYPERNCPTLSDCTDKTSWEILELKGKKKEAHMHASWPYPGQCSSLHIPCHWHSIPTSLGKSYSHANLTFGQQKPSKLKWFVIKLIRIWAFTPARLRWEFNLIPEVWVDSWAMSFLSSPFPI